MFGPGPSTPCPALEGYPRDPPRRRARARPPRATDRPGRHRRRPALSVRGPGPADQAPPASLRREKVVQRDRLRHHRPDRRRGERSRDRVMGSRTRWTVENTVHRVRDVVLKRTSPRSELITRPAVLAVVRDLIRSPLKLAGYVNTAAGRRAHTDRPPASSLSKASLDQIRRAGQTPGSWDDFNHSLYHAARGRYIDAVGGTSYPATSDLLHPWGMRCAVSTCRVLAV